MELPRRRASDKTPVDQMVKALVPFVVVVLCCTVVVVMFGAFKFAKLDDTTEALNNSVAALNNSTTALNASLIASQRADSSNNATVCLLSLAKDQRLPLDQRRPITRDMLKEICKLTDEEIDRVLK